METTAQRVIRWGLVSGWAAVIFAFSAIPGSNVPGSYGSLAHFIEYAVLGGLLYFAFRCDQPRATALLLAVAGASLYGITDEFHQSFVPMRVPDVRDWAMDTLGAIAGATTASLAEKFLGQRGGRQ